MVVRRYGACPFQGYSECASIPTRVFQRGADPTRVSCSNRPAVEMTRFIDVDLETGAVRDIPSESRLVRFRGPYCTGSTYTDCFLAVQDFPKARCGVMFSDMKTWIFMSNKA